MRCPVLPPPPRPAPVCASKTTGKYFSCNILLFLPQERESELTELQSKSENLSEKVVQLENQIAELESNKAGLQNDLKKLESKSQKQLEELVH